MCEGFGVICDRGLNLYFVEPEDYDLDCSHSTILNRLGWADSKGIIDRNFIRLEFPDWTPESFQVDEVSSLPGWASSEEDYWKVLPEIKEKAILLLERIRPFYEEIKNSVEAARYNERRADGRNYGLYLNGKISHVVMQKRGEESEVRRSAKVKASLNYFVGKISTIKEYVKY